MECFDISLSRVGSIWVVECTKPDWQEPDFHDEYDTAHHCLGTIMDMVLPTGDYELIACVDQAA
jgi:hypothetical protein